MSEATETTLRALRALGVSHIGRRRRDSDTQIYLLFRDGSEVAWDAAAGPPAQEPGVCAIIAEYRAAKAEERRLA